MSAVGNDDAQRKLNYDDELSGMGFEQAISELEGIVAKLEEGKTPLEEALMLFERGAKLAKFCERKLEWVERKLQMVVRTPDGKIEIRDFEIPEEDEGMSCELRAAMDEALPEETSPDEELPI